MNSFFKKYIAALLQRFIISETHMWHCWCPHVPKYNIYAWSHQWARIWLTAAQPLLLKEEQPHRQAGADTNLFPHHRAQDVNRSHPCLQLGLSFPSPLTWNVWRLAGTRVEENKQAECRRESQSLSLGPRGRHYPTRPPASQHGGLENSSLGVRPGPQLNMGGHQHKRLQTKWFYMTRSLSSAPKVCVCVCGGMRKTVISLVKDKMIAGITRGLKSGQAKWKRPFVRNAGLSGGANGAFGWQ